MHWFLNEQASFKSFFVHFLFRPKFNLQRLSKIINLYLYVTSLDLSFKKSVFLFDSVSFKEINRNFIIFTSDLMCRSKAVEWVSTPRIYPWSRCFLVNSIIVWTIDSNMWFWMNWHSWQKKQYMHDQCDVVIILDLKDELHQADKMNIRIQSNPVNCFGK